MKADVRSLRRFIQPTFNPFIVAAAMDLAINLDFALLSATSVKAGRAETSSLKKRGRIRNLRCGTIDTDQRRSLAYALVDRFMANDNDPKENETGSLRAAIDALADAREALRRAQPRAAGLQGAPAEKAAHIRDLRDYRHRLFGSSLFGEPAWDILLDLFIAGERGQRLSVAAASMTDDVKPTTGLRWLQTLEHEGLIQRESDPQERKREWVSLAPETRGILLQWLERA